MICKLLRSIGIKVWSEDEIIKEVREMQGRAAGQLAQPAPGPAVPVHGEYVAIRSHEITRQGK